MDDRDALMEFGLNRLESDIYICLLENPDSTGYKTAQLLNKPAANVYKGLNSLCTKGLLSEDASGRNRIYSPVPMDEFLTRQDLEFQEKRRDLENRMKKYAIPSRETILRKMDGLPQVLARAEKMVNDAEHVIIVDAFPEMAEQLRPLLEKKAREGIRVLVKTYGPFAAAGCRIFKSAFSDEIWKRQPERAFDIAVDGTAFIIANFDTNYERTLEALYGDHIYLSLKIYSSLLGDIMLTRGEQEYPPEGFEELIMEHLPAVRKNLTGKKKGGE